MDVIDVIFLMFVSFYLFIVSEENEKPADLNQRVIFKSKRSQDTEKSDESCDSKAKSKKRPEPTKSKLSFQDEDDDDDE